MNRATQKNLHSVSEKTLSKSMLDENTKALEFYKKYKEISDITEKIDIAMGRKKTYNISLVQHKILKLIPIQSHPLHNRIKFKTTQDRYNFLNESGGKCNLLDLQHIS